MEENKIKQTEKVEKKIEESKKEIKKIETPREVAIVNAYSQRISTKYAIAICKMIYKKDIGSAITELEMVMKKKKAVPTPSLEVGHKPGKMGGGKYPLKASKVFIDVLKQLKANATVSMIEKPVITIAMANQASRPFRRGGTKGKRTHIHLEAREKTKLVKKKK